MLALSASGEPAEGATAAISMAKPGLRSCARRTAADSSVSYSVPPSGKRITTKGVPVAMPLPGGPAAESSGVTAAVLSLALLSPVAAALSSDAAAGSSVPLPDSQAARTSSRTAAAAKRRGNGCDSRVRPAAPAAGW